MRDDGVAALVDPLGGRESDLAPQQYLAGKVGHGRGQVRVAGVERRDDAGVVAQAEAPRGPARAVLAGVSRVGKLLQHAGSDERVDGLDRGRTSERCCAHRLGGGEGAGIPREVEHSVDAGATGARVEDRLTHS